MHRQSEFGEPDKYKTPPDCQVPNKYEDQRDSTEYPNVTVDQYRNTPSTVPETKIMPFYDCLERNSHGMILLGANDYTARIMNGSVYGINDVVEDEPILKNKEAAFKMTTNTPVTCLKFLNDDTFLMGETDGQVTLYSTQSPLRQDDQINYNLFRVGKKNEHNALVQCLEIFRSSSTKAITGDEDGTLVTWDLPSADLVSIDKLRMAHIDSINDIATVQDNDYCFVTASNDKSVFTWDLRDPKPCSALMEFHDYFIKTCSYLDENRILVGDQTGMVYIIDAKMPKKVYMEKEVHDEEIHKFILKGKHIITLTDSNRLQVHEFKADDMISVLDVPNTPDMLRSAVWTSDSEFYVAGWSSFMHKYKI